MAHPNPDGSRPVAKAKEAAEHLRRLAEHHRRAAGVKPEHVEHPGQAK